MVNINGFYLCIVGFAAMVVDINGDLEEPKCLSRFDYDYKMLQKLTNLENTVETLKESLRQSENEMKDLSRKIKASGSVYIRWGRSECQDEAEIIYKGFTAGKKYSDKAGGSDTICLPEDPSWSNFTTGTDGGRGYVYGTEIDISEPSGVFENRVNEQDIPCAACHTKTSSVVMIPGRSHCYTGWHLEYSGYLMTAFHGHHGPHNHVCVDHHPESLHRGEANDNQHILYVAVSKCGSLPCPPYGENKELACVVCSL
ncbi:hypothetical protein ACF0H5_005118 [Mactra antiquata]